MDEDELFIEDDGWDVYEDDDYDDPWDDDEDEELYVNLKDYEEEAVGIAEDRERAVNLLRTAIDRTLTTWFISDKTRMIYRHDYACHAGLVENMLTEPLVFASCFNARKGLQSERVRFLPNEVAANDIKDVSEKYWDFIMGPDSPWRLLFKIAPPEKITMEDGTLVGFFLEPSTVAKYPKLTLNLCIAARMIGEERTTIKMWADLVDRGMHPADALYLSRMIKWSTEEGLEGLVTTRSHNDSSHWPLLFSAYWKEGYFSFERFRNGTPDLSEIVETHYWFGSKKYDDWDPSMIETEKKDRMRNRYFTIDEAISSFLAWQDKNGQLVKERIAA